MWDDPVVFLLSWTTPTSGMSTRPWRRDVRTWYDLADDYFERSVRLMMAEQPPGCGRTDCVRCATWLSARRQRWWHWLHR